MSDEQPPHPPDPKKLVQDRLARATDQLGALRRTDLKSALTGRLQETRRSLDEQIQKSAHSDVGMVASGLLNRARQGSQRHNTPEAGSPVPPAAEAPESTLRGEELKRRQDEANAMSRKRLAFLMNYARDPESHPLFQEKPVVYRVLSEERSHQIAAMQRLRDELNQLPPPPEQMGLSAEEIAADPIHEDHARRRAELSRRVNQTYQVQAQLAVLLKEITGVDPADAEAYAPSVPVPETTLDTSTADALGNASALLARLKRR